jgi:AhpD family alkylhydroperoxidase
MFTVHTIESAPAAARRSMTATISHNGYLPTAVALMATSPELLDGFLKMSAAFDGTTLDPLAREVVIMTMATRNGCHLCVAMHSARLEKLGADAALIAALRSGGRARHRRLHHVHPGQPADRRPGRRTAAPVRLIPAIQARSGPFTAPGASCCYLRRLGLGHDWGYFAVLFDG